MEHAPFKVGAPGLQLLYLAYRNIALVKRRLYKRLVIGDIREGSYVLLKEYTLERADRLYEEGEVLCGLLLFCC